MENYEQLKLNNQLCFPLYACAKEVVRLYTPFLDPLGLTYTQYITMMAMWEHREISVKELGRLLWLDSGTLTPLLKKLEAKGFVTRTRSLKDERSVTVALTDKGDALKEQAASIPFKVGSCLCIEPGEAAALHDTLHRILARFSGEGEDGQKQ